MQIKSSEAHFTKEIPMSNKPVKIRPTTLIIREMRKKIAMRYYHTPAGMAKVIIRILKNG